MRCETLQRSFEAYLSGELGPDISESIERHLELCPSCARLLLEEDADLDKLLASEWYANEWNVDLTTPVMARVTKRVSKPWLWVVLGWSLYLSMWLGGLIAVQYLRQGPVVTVLKQLLTASRTVAFAIRTVLTSLQYYQLSTFGVVLTFGLATLLLAGIGLLSREDLA